MSLILSFLAGAVPFAIAMYFLMKRQKKLGSLEEQNKIVMAKNDFLHSQLEKEMALSDKRSKQIHSLLATGKFSYIELPEDPSSINNKGPSNL